MFWLSLLILFAFILNLKADLCLDPLIPNGKVEGEKSLNSFVGSVICDPGYHLVGSASRIKCRGGQWSVQPLPACAAIGCCLDLEQIANGRNVPIHGSRQSAFKFKCRKGFKLYGEKRTYCEGDRWSHSSMPVCTAAGCDTAGLLDIPYGEGRAMLGGGVYRYRCNLGVEMRGHNTIFCDGEYWNGTVPSCLVTPGTPELSLSVSGRSDTPAGRSGTPAGMPGTPAEYFKTGDLLDVSCHATSGHPVPDVLISWPGQQKGENKRQRLSNSLVLAVTEEDEGRKITCTAENMAGISHTSTLLHIMSPPTSVQLSGPLTVHHNREYEYQCRVWGGNPTPDVQWSVRDHLGNTREVAGDWVEEGVGRMMLKVKDTEKKMDIMCAAENPTGRATHTMSVKTHYLPSSVHIDAPDTVDTGEGVTLLCTSMASFPSPTIKWRVETFGNITEVDDTVGDVITDVMKDGSITARSELNVTLATSVKYIRAECRGTIDNLGESRSTFHRIRAMAPLTVPNISGLAELSSLPGGHPVSLACSVDYSEKVEFLSWFIDGELRRKDQHLDKENGRIMSIWEYVPGMGESEIICQLNDNKEYSTKITFTVEAPVKIVHLDNRDIFKDYSVFWLPDKNTVSPKVEDHIEDNEIQDKNEHIKEMEDFEAVKQIFMNIIEKVDTKENFNEEEFRRSEKEPKGTSLTLRNHPGSSLETDEQLLVTQSSSQRNSCHVPSVIISAILLLTYEPYSC